MSLYQRKRLPLSNWNPQTDDQLTKMNLPVDFQSQDNIRLSPDGDNYFVPGSSGSRLGSVKTGDVQDWPSGVGAFSDRNVCKRSKYASGVMPIK